MASKKLRQFDRQLKAIAAPEMDRHEFVFDGRRTFRRDVRHDPSPYIQIVEFQIGTKSLSGRFTVNLGVYNESYQPEDQKRADGPLQPSPAQCMSDLSDRLGYFCDPPRGFWSRLLRLPSQPPHDYWWPQHENDRKMQSVLRQVIDCIIHRGIPWLDKMSCVEAFDWAKHELARRKKWKAEMHAGQGSAHFESQSFDDWLKTPGGMKREQRS
ncbi:MAG: hypothetical protein WDZ59_17465 [Pirellulales bacterium]